MARLPNRQPQDIETIIRAFEGYALGDIRHNKDKPIAAFILMICFIDSVSAYRYDYKTKPKKRTEWLIRDYMPAYKGIGLYEEWRDNLVHNYSSNGNFDINHIGNEDVPYRKKGKVTYINTNVLLGYLESAFQEIATEFRTPGSEANKNALLTSIAFPVFQETEP